MASRESWSTGAGASVQFFVQDGAAPDLTVKYEGKSKVWTWNVHRRVLMGKSPVFRAMFDHHLLVSFSINDLLRLEC